jgi:hypothetical protein
VALFTWKGASVCLADTSLVRAEQSLVEWKRSLTIARWFEALPIRCSSC